MHPYKRIGVAVLLWLGFGAAGAAQGGLIPDPCMEEDGDCIPYQLDKCSLDSRNTTATCDTDNDGYGNVCDADFDQSFTVTSVDFSMYFIPSFKSGAPSARGTDMDCSGTVTSTDFSMYFIPKFKGLMGGAVPGPSGLPCAGTPGCN